MPGLVLNSGEKSSEARHTDSCSPLETNIKEKSNKKEHTHQYVEYVEPKDFLGGPEVRKPPAMQGT